MPPQAQLPAPLSRTPRVSERPSRWFPWTSVLVISGIFLGILIVLNAQSEIAYWYLAAAREHWIEAEYGAIQGDVTAAEENRKQAFEILEQAFLWSPEDTY